VEKRSLTPPDYIVLGGWICTLGWYICSIVSLQIQIKHPLVEPDLTTDSVGYLVVSWIPNSVHPKLIRILLRLSSYRLTSLTSDFTSQKLL
jgi:hypothetical protein